MLANQRATAPFSNRAAASTGFSFAFSAICRGVRLPAMIPSGKGWMGTSAFTVMVKVPPFDSTIKRPSIGLLPARRCWPRTCTGIVVSEPNWNNFWGRPAPSPRVSHLLSLTTLPKHNRMPRLLRCRSKWRSSPTFTTPRLTSEGSTWTRGGCRTWEGSRDRN